MRNLIARLVVCLSILTTIQVGWSYAAGIYDPTFGTNGRANFNPGVGVVGVGGALQPDGKIVLLGYIASESAGADIIVARINSDGSPDTGFGADGKVVYAFPNRDEIPAAVALQPNGKIIVAGRAAQSANPSASDFIVVRFNADGTLDTTYGAGGEAIVNQGVTDMFLAVAVQTDGKAVAVGLTSDCSCGAIIRFNENGTLDSSFSNGGLLFLDVPNTTRESFRAVAVYPNGRIVAGGLGEAMFNSMNDVLVMLEANGTPAQDFGNQGIVLNNLSAPPIISLGFDMALTPDGKIITVSPRTNRYLSNGAPDPTFNAQPGVEEPYGSRVAVMTDGRFLTVRYNPEQDTILRNRNGGVVGSIETTGSDVLVQPDNKIILISGGFSVTRLLNITSKATRLADFDRDEKTDFAFLRSSTSSLHVRGSRSAPVVYNFAEPASTINRVIPERFLRQFTSPTVYWKTENGLGKFCGLYESQTNCLQWGVAGDLPVGGDYNGDTTAEFTVFRPSDGTWWIYNTTNNTYYAVRWGTNGDRPVPADYDYDGVTDLAVYRPSNGTWWILRSSDNGYFTVPFGIASDTPLTGDYDGDGKADFTVYRASEGNWYQFLTTEGYRVVRFGLPTDVPVPGDYDGDGKHDIAVFRDGLWYLLQSREGLKTVQWGEATDSPVAIRYDR